MKTTLPTGKWIIITFALISLIDFWATNVLASDYEMCFSTCGCGKAPTGNHSNVCDEGPGIRASLGCGVIDPDISLHNFDHNYLDEANDNENKSVEHYWRVDIRPVFVGENPYPLFGWLHITVDDDGVGGWKQVNIQAGNYDNSVSGVGEFLFDEISDSCKPSYTGTITGSHTKLSKWNILPCLFVKTPQHLAGSGFGIGFSPDATLRHATFLYRIDFPPCPIFNSKREFTIWALAQRRSDGDSSKMRTQYLYMKDYVYGAADPQPPKNSAFDCTQDFSGVSWAQNPEKIYKLVSRSVTCPIPGKLPKNKLFYGRCEAPIGYGITFTEENSNYSRPYRCDYTPDKPDEDYYINLTDHQNYIHNVLHASQACSSCVQVWDESRTLGHSTNSGIGNEIWSLRQSHGIAMTVVTMFLVPISFFVSRYFKETFMDDKIVHLHVWYAIHIHLSVSTVGILSAGAIPAIWGRTFYGFSMHTVGRLHVTMGWLGIFVFILAFLSNGFRCAARKAKILSIFFHFLLGIIFYGLCIVGMLLSCLIPGSPSGLHDIHIKSGFEPIPIFIVIRVGVDVVFNILMMKNMANSDEEMNVKGKRLFATKVVPIPFCDLTSTMDALGDRFRNRMLKVYVIISLILTVLTCLFIMFNSSAGRFFGPTTATHRPNGRLYTARHVEAYFD